MTGGPSNPSLFSHYLNILSVQLAKEGHTTLLVLGLALGSPLSGKSHSAITKSTGLAGITENEYMHPLQPIQQENMLGAEQINPPNIAMGVYSNSHVLTS